jgi:hypothetical protein
MSDKKFEKPLDGYIDWSRECLIEVVYDRDREISRLQKDQLKFDEIYNKEKAEKEYWKEKFEKSVETFVYNFLEKEKTIQSLKSEINDIQLELETWKKKAHLSKYPWNPNVGR